MARREGLVGQDELTGRRAAVDRRTARVGSASSSRPGASDADIASDVAGFPSLVVKLTVTVAVAAAGATLSERGRIAAPCTLLFDVAR